MCDFSLTVGTNVRVLQEVKREALENLTGARGARDQNGPKLQISLLSEARIVEKTSVLLVREAKILEKTSVFRVLVLKLVEKTSVFLRLGASEGPQRVSRMSPERPQSVSRANTREN